MASYKVNERAVARARKLIDARQYVLDSEGQVGGSSPRCMPRDGRRDTAATGLGVRSRHG